MTNKMHEMFQIARNEKDINKKIEGLEKILDCGMDYVVIGELSKALIGRNKGNDRNRARIYLTKRINSKHKREAFFSKATLAKLEIFEGNYDNARKLLRGLFSTEYEQYAISQLAKIEALEGHYDKALLYYLRLPGQNSELLLFLCKMNNVFVDMDFKDEYMINQIANYSLDNAILHIEERMATKREENTTSVFDSRIDIEMLMEHVSNHLEQEYCVTSYLRDSYTIPMPHLSTDGKEFLRVVTLSGTKDILDMYPCNGNTKKLTKIM